MSRTTSRTSPTSPHGKPADHFQHHAAHQFRRNRAYGFIAGLYGTLVIPPAVVDELRAKADIFPGAAQVPSLADISILTPADHLLVKSLASRVHSGEAECLALAMEHPGSLLLLDDLAAREFAASNGLLFTGTIGCLVDAKQQGLIPAIEPLLYELRFWISDRLASRVLRDAGEN